MNVTKTKIDSKGRISIPYYMRTFLGIDTSSEVKIAAEGKEIVLTPAMKGIRLKMRFRNFRSLLKTMKIISASGINIGNENITNIDRRGAEWSVMLEGNPDHLKSFIEKIKKSGNARSVVIG